MEPLVALTCIQYGPGGVVEVMSMFRLVEPEPCDARVMFAGSRETRGPDGVMVALNLIVPEGPAISVTTMASD